MKLLKSLKQFFCKHDDWYYKMFPSTVNCEHMKIYCRRCEKELKDNGLDC